MKYFRSTLVWAVLALFAAMAANGAAWAANASQSPEMRPLPVGQAFPDLVLQGPFTPQEAAQLGLKPGAKSFRLADIKADTVVLVVFSMYCPFCQKEGPALVEANALIRERGLAGSVAMVGLGAGNSDFEVAIYRDKFKVDFPLFQDKDFTAYKSLGQVGTPFYYILSRGPDGFTIVDESLGCMTSPKAFLDSVQAKTGAKPAPVQDTKPEAKAKGKKK
ncbi:peroxiredoxin family protein [Fundidesulfovibrio agrisoli]|uniref:peroxiredoxin family protein n=1 Tax=Fundidesulfovibrio agrisoli TaxID=2922717 RepID=UPI001FABB8CE|nr:TlpA disulfide reductase family protein [Fundidesulfovibrio agrisoli]